MSDPHIVTPQEAYKAFAEQPVSPPTYASLVFTVATEPDRTRAAVVKALRSHGRRYRDSFAMQDADAIENGTPL